MPEPLWSDVKEWFDPEVNGALPDVCVSGTSLEDWQTVLDLVRGKGWTIEYTVGGEVVGLPESAADMLDRPGDESAELRVWLARGVLMIFRVYSVSSIDFDVDLRELQGQQRLDVFCGFLRAIGQALDKPVVMTPEGSPDFPVIGYDIVNDRVSLLTTWDGPRPAILES